MAELKMKSNTVSAVDLFKCIFAICVVAIHTMAFKDHGESAYFAFTYCITSFAVPYFFVCSGYFLGRKIYGKDLQKSDYRLTETFKTVFNMGMLVLSYCFSK